MTKVLAGIDAAFAGVPKPEHFTDAKTSATWGGIR